MATREQVAALLDCEVEDIPLLEQDLGVKFEQWTVDHLVKADQLLIENEEGEDEEDPLDEGLDEEDEDE